MKPKILRKPKIGVSAMIFAAIIFAQGAIVINVLREQIPYTYTVGEGEILTHDPFAWYGAVAAIAIVLIAVLAALSLIAAVTSAEKKSVLIRNTVLISLLSVVLLAAAFVFTLFAMKIPPLSETFYSYKDEAGRQIVISEANTIDGYILKVFDIEGESANLLSSTEINLPAESEERYILEWISDDVLTISFEDGAQYRTLSISVK